MTHLWTVKADSDGCALTSDQTNALQLVNFDSGANIFIIIIIIIV